MSEATKLRDFIEDLDGFAQQGDAPDVITGCIALRAGKAAPRK